MLQKVIAVDFDGTLCEDDRWPEIGKANRGVIDALLREQANGAKIILWTCRAGEQLAEAVKWCTREGIVFDAVNANLPEHTELFGGDSRKVHASEYWDDRSVIVGKDRISNLTAVIKGSRAYPGVETTWLDEGISLRCRETDLGIPRGLKRGWMMCKSVIAALKRKKT
ncbi:hypothetical protein JRC49_03445 [Clostridiales bacterium FE2011]|nr:hypothetical protein JRC49_03445 [Clostridiales bacterium FE2011]